MLIWIPKVIKETILEAEVEDLVTEEGGVDVLIVKETIKRAKKAQIAVIGRKGEMHLEWCVSGVTKQGIMPITVQNAY